MGACISFDSECNPVDDEPEVDERFTHCCNNQIESITYDTDGWKRLIDDLEVISTTIASSISELWLSDSQFYLQKGFTAWTCTMSSVGVNLWYGLAAFYYLLVSMNSESFLTD